MNPSLRSLPARLARELVAALGIRIVRRATHAFGLALLLATTSATTSLRAQPAAPTDEERQLVRQVVRVLEHVHLRQWRLDDALSEKVFERAIDVFDPQHVYLLQADIDRLATQRTALDDQLSSGEIRFARELWQLYHDRLAEVVAELDSILDGDIDLTVDESLVVDRDDAPFPATPAERRELWRKRAKLLLLEKIAAGDEPAKARDLIAKRFANLVRRIGQMDTIELIETYLSAVAAVYDPHSNYMAPRTLENFEIQMRLELDGIGAQLRADEGYTTITRVLPGGAAAREGHLSEGDRILAVAQGDDGEWVDAVEMKLGDVVQMIRGKRGTVVRLQVRHAEGGQEEIRLVRARIELAEQQAHGEVMVVDDPANGRALRLGVIDIPSFYRDLSMDPTRRNQMSTARDVRRILGELSEFGIDGVVVDLRENGGGALQEALAVTGLFIDGGPVVQVQGVGGEVQQLDDPVPGVVWEGPLVVLTSHRSASASEIFAAAIQDYRRGLIVGDEATHGKGTVQRLQTVGRPDHPLGALKLTTARFFRPDGPSTQLRGVRADIALPSLIAHMPIGERDLEGPMDFATVPPSLHPSDSLVDPDLVRELRRRSQKRRAKSAAFQEIQEKVREYIAERDRGTVSLQQEQYLAAHDGEKDPTSALGGPPAETIERDAYLEEVLAIATDYVRMLRERR